MTNRVSRRGLAGAAALAPAALIGSAHAQSKTESTFERVMRTKVLRIAALPGELPYFSKDIATGDWSGSAIDMAKDIAKIWDAKLEYVESTYGNSVLDLQANKVDIAFALNPAVEALPTTIFYDRAGRERARLTAPADWTKPEAHALIDRLLALKD